MLKRIAKIILYKLVELSLYGLRRHQSDNQKKKRLLIVRIDAIGDFIIFSPMLKYYRMLYPDYYITLLVNKLALDLAERFVDINELIPFDRRKFSSDLIYRRRLLKEIRERAFDVVIYPTYSRESNGDYIVRFSGAPEKIGFDSDTCNITPKKKLRNDKLYTKLIPATPGIIVETERNKEFVEALGINVNDYLPIFKPSEDDEKEGNTILFEKGLKIGNPFVVIFPGASWKQKIWTLEKYAQVVAWLKKGKGVEVVICGSKSETHLVKRIESVANIPVINMVGNTTLPVLAAILKKSLLYIGSDTGILHLAAAVGTPTICIMGGGHFGRFFPYGDLEKNRIVYKTMDCFGCNWRCRYKTVRCIEEISVEQVMKEIKNILNDFNGLRT